MMLAKRYQTPATLGSRAANDNTPRHRVIVQLSPYAPVTLVEVEVFDSLIGSFAAFAANDNERLSPNPSVIRGPPSETVNYTEFHQRKEVA